MRHDEPMSTPWDDDFSPSSGTRRTLAWARDNGAETLGEAYDLLDQLEASNDVPEVLGHDDTVDLVREELDLGIELLGPDTPLDLVG